MTTNREPLTLQRLKKAALVILAVVFLFFVGNDIIMPLYVNQGGTMEVPSAIGLPFEQAKRMIDSLGLEGREGDVRASQEYPAGTVIIQNPLPGTVVKKGRRVYLTVSGGEALVSVPNLRGKTVRDAKFALERAGLKLGVLHYTPVEEYPANTIVDQSIPWNEKVKRGTPVSIVVSQGAGADRVEVPDVVGKPLTEAGRLLANRGLKLGAVTYQSAPMLLPNTVVDQYPRPGDLAEHGQTINLFVAEEGKRQLPPEN